MAAAKSDFASRRPIEAIVLAILKLKQAFVDAGLDAPVELVLTSKEEEQRLCRLPNPAALARFSAADPNVTSLGGLLVRGGTLK